MRLPIIAAAAMLTACASEPRVTAAGPGSVVLSYWAGAEQAAFDAAQRHCATHGRNAVLRSERVEPPFQGGRTGNFECR